MRSLLLTLSLLCGAPALAQHEPQRVEHAIGEDRFAAGNVATSGDAVAGDLVLAGGRVHAAAPVGGDLVAAGGEVRVDASTAQDLYTAGGRVTIDAPVGRNARIAGGNVEVGRRTRISGNATVAGGEVRLLGEIAGHLAVAGGRVFVNGRVDGNAEVAGGEIELGPEARIAGDLRYRSRSELVRSPAAVVEGAVVRDATQAPWDDGEGAGVRAAAAFLVLWTLGLMILAALVALLPRFSARIEAVARERPGLSLLAGFAVLVATPIVVAILLATVVGVPIGLLLLAGYGVALILGYAGAAVVVGRMALRRMRPAGLERKGMRALSAALAMLLISLLAAIPLLGWLAVVVAWLVGIGTLVTQARARPSRATGA